MIPVDGGSLLATADSGIGTVKDLGGKRVGVIPNTTTEKALAATLAGASIQATVIPVAEIANGLRGLEEGRVDAYASDRLLLVGLLATAKDPGKLRAERGVLLVRAVRAHDASRGTTPFKRG